MAFNPKKELINLKGKAYLQANARVVWFRNDHPTGAITTDIVSFEPLCVRATVADGNGQILGIDHAGAKPTAGAVWGGREVEKACTAAIGRALALAGYGTLQAMKEEVGDDHLADSPIPPNNANGNGRPQASRSNAPAPVQSQQQPPRNITAAADKFKQTYSDTPPLAREADATTGEPPFERYEAHKVSFHKIANQDNKLSCVIHCYQGVNIIVYTSQAFRDAGVTDNQIDLWKKAGTVEFDHKVIVCARLVKNSKGNDKWEIKSIDMGNAPVTETDLAFQQI